MRIVLDVDGVIADNHTAWLNRVNAAQDRRHDNRWTPADLTQWEFWKDLSITQAELFKHWTPDIYESEVQPYFGALEVVEQLREMRRTIVYLTTCASADEYLAKCDWLRRHGFYAAGDQIVGIGPWAYYKTKAEAYLDGDVLVDDHVANCESWPGYSLLLTQPHNRRATTHVKRLKALSDLPLELGQLEWARLHASDNGAFGTQARELLKPASAPERPAATALPTDKQDRKDTPLCTGVLDYFAIALAEVARVSKAGNDQHTPGQPLHWAWGKSSDHADCILRHLAERGTRDTDGQRHTAKVAWRALALLVEELVAEGAPLPRAARRES